jgi:sec-independent protein translocase protein TatC
MGAEHAVRMTLGEHLGELRARLMRSIAVLLAAVVVAMVFYKDLVEIITLPHFQAMEWCGLSREHARLFSCSYAAPVLAVMKLAFIAALFVTSPYMAWELWGFLAAGLYRDEKKYVARFAPISFLLFVLGCVFGYFLLVPYALYGMARMMPAEQVQPLFQFGEYLSLVLTLTLLLGAVFQLPLLMVFFSTVGVIRPASYEAWRRHAIVANVVVAAAISPPDVVSMLLFAVPLLLLYEVGLLCSRLCAEPAGPFRRS